MSKDRQSLNDRILATKRAKRERLQRVQSGPRIGAGSNRRFQFRPLDFTTDASQFELMGGAHARYPLVEGFYARPRERSIRCLHLKAPSTFTFRSNLDGVLRFVYELRRQVFVERNFVRLPGDDRPFVYLNLDEIEAIDLKGALILAAELDRVRRVLGFLPVLDDYNWAPEVRAVLHSLGLHDIIQASRRDDRVPIDERGVASLLGGLGIQIIKMRSGVKSSNIVAREIRDELYAACYPFSVARPQLYNVLVEAFNNTREHAYPLGSGEDGIPTVKGWWAGALVHHQQGQFELAVYDQGIGIPERFARQHAVSHQERGIIGGDLSVLKRATEHGESSTAESGRGNGLWQMTELTKTIVGSRVEFTSLQASLSYQHGIIQRAFVPPQRFCGTMIGWTVPYKSEL